MLRSHVVCVSEPGHNKTRNCSRPVRLLSPKSGGAFSTALEVAPLLLETVTTAPRVALVLVRGGCLLCICHGKT